MADQGSTVFNAKLIGIASAIVLICCYALWRVAADTGNWHGLHLSLLHVGLVAVGTVLALRARPSRGERS